MEKGMVNLALSIFVHTSKGPLTCRKFLRRGADSFASPPKEGVLRIFIALGRVWTGNLRSNGMHANHYKTEDDNFQVTYWTYWTLQSNNVIERVHTLR
jgi:hypothetical protein